MNETLGLPETRNHAVSRNPRIHRLEASQGPSASLRGNPAILPFDAAAQEREEEKGFVRCLAVMGELELGGYRPPDPRPLFFILFPLRRALCGL